MNSVLHVEDKGFTLVELLIVIAIIGILAAVAIPNLHRARMSANEIAAIAGCKTVCTAQHDYNTQSYPHTYAGQLSCLKTGHGAGEVPYIDPDLGNGLKSGYYFEIFAGPPGPHGSIWSWSMSAWPIIYKSTGVRSFYIDASGVIRGSDIGGGPASVRIPAI